MGDGKCPDIYECRLGVSTSAVSKAMSRFWKKRYELLLREFKHIRPSCDACGQPGAVQYDSNGEGLYWLCGRTDGDHDESHYCGTKIYSLKAGL